jgi:hypothetical protein
VLLNARFLAQRSTALTSNDRPKTRAAYVPSQIAELAQRI